MTPKERLEQLLADVDGQIADALWLDEPASALEAQRDRVELRLVTMALSEVRAVGEETTINGRSVNRSQLLERERELRDRVARKAQGRSTIRQIIPNV